MNICFFNRHAYSLFSDEQGPVGGSERAMSNLAKTLAKRNDTSVLLITQANTLSHPITIDSVNIYPLHHVKKALFGRIKRRPDLLLRFLWDTFQAVRKCKCDIVLVSQATIETMVVYLAARYAKIPIVYRIASNMELEHDILRDVIFFRKEFFARYFETLLSKFDAVIAQTPEQAAIIHKRFKRTVPVIPNMLTMHPISQSQETSSRKHSVLWVGRSHPMKRPEVFFDLAKCLPHLKFVAVVAPAIGETDYFNSLQIQARAIPNLEFIPGLAPDEIQRVYADAKVFVLTSQSEGFPNVMAEAMCNGAICLSTMINPGGWLSENYGVPACGYFCNNNFDLLANLTEEFISDTNLWSTSASLAISTVTDKMNPGNVAQNYMNVFSTILNSSTL